jgi:hypothetical protein
MSLEDLSMDARDELAQLARQLAENPATRKQFLQMTKQVKPDMPIPELEIEAYTDKRVSEAQYRVEQLEAKLREKEAVDELNRRRNELMKKGYVRSDDEVNEVEKVMLEKGITNHESAAEYYNWMKQAAEPTASSYNPSGLSKFDLTDYWKNPTQGARREAAKVLAEIRRPNRPIGL